MQEYNETLKQYLREQIALEEHLSGIIVEQLHEVEGDEDKDARSLLERIAAALKGQFGTLNGLLDELELGATETNARRVKGSSANGAALTPLAGNGLAAVSVWQGKKERRLSQILRDDFAALNLVAINNSLLHTSALALEHQGVADVALRHVENLFPLIVTMGTVVTDVAARELGTPGGSSEGSLGHSGAAKTALKNIRRAWRRALVSYAR